MFLRRTYKGKRGNAAVRADVAAADKVSAVSFDAIIIPGGQAPDRMRLHQSMIDLVKQEHGAGKLLAAICHGPQLLISAGLVRGCRVTSWSSIAVDLRNAGADWVDAPVVRGGNIITSRRPADLPRFNKAIIEALQA